MKEIIEQLNQASGLRMLFYGFVFLSSVGMISVTLIEVIRTLLRSDKIQEDQKCSHKNCTREDGLDECLDCGARNY